MENQSSTKVPSTQVDTTAAEGETEQSALEEGDDKDMKTSQKVHWVARFRFWVARKTFQEKGETENGVGVSICNNDRERQRKPTLFVDGIEEAFGYHHIRGLFALFGRISNVFVQRKRELGRCFRFGIVRLFSDEQAVAATTMLDGLGVGGAALSVALARFPKDVCSVSQGTHGKASRAMEAEPPKFRGGGVEGFSGQQIEWRETLEGKLSGLISSSLDELSCLVHAFVPGERIPMEFLFPEIVPWPLGSEEMKSPATSSPLQCSLPSVAGSEDGGFEGGFNFGEDEIGASSGQEGSSVLPREQVCNAQLKEIDRHTVRD